MAQNYASRTEPALVFLFQDCFSNRFKLLKSRSARTSLRGYMVNKLRESKDRNSGVVQVWGGMVVCEDHYALNPDFKQLQGWGRVNYAFYFGGVPLYLQAWTGFKVTST
jgi:hypothetical protein